MYHLKFLLGRIHDAANGYQQLPRPENWIALTDSEREILANKVERARTWGKVAVTGKAALGVAGIFSGMVLCALSPVAGFGLMAASGAGSGYSMMRALFKAQNMDFMLIHGQRPIRTRLLPDPSPERFGQPSAT